MATTPRTAETQGGACEMLAEAVRNSQLEPERARQAKKD